MPRILQKNLLRTLLDVTLIIALISLRLLEMSTSNCVENAVVDCSTSSFDTELVSKIIMGLKCGKAADIDGLSNEHLSFCHPILSVILSRLFDLILSNRYIPLGFKRSYIVRIPKPKDTRTKAMTCYDFRGIAISSAISKVFEYCFLECFHSLLVTEKKQFDFKKGISCSHAIYTVREFVDRHCTH